MNNDSFFHSTVRQMIAEETAPLVARIEELETQLAEVITGQIEDIRSITDLYKRTPTTYSVGPLNRVIDALVDHGIMEEFRP